MKCLTRIAILLLLGAPPAPAAELKTRNVLLVTLDGLRWQEVFHGADEALMTADKTPGGGVASGALPALRADFAAATPQERRQKLMRFSGARLSRRGRPSATAISAAPHACSTPNMSPIPVTTSCSPARRTI